jgi:hypothetical protein
MRIGTTLLLLLLPLSTPAAAENAGDEPTPERVFRQLRWEPAIETREEAERVLAQATPDSLWGSAKLAVDARIKDLLSHPAFGSLDPEIRSELHAGMLEIRSSFWERDPEGLSSAEEALRGVLGGGQIRVKAGSRENGAQLQDRLEELVREVEMAMMLQQCTRPELHLEAADRLDCMLRVGAEDRR